MYQCNSKCSCNGALMKALSLYKSFFMIAGTILLFIPVTDYCLEINKNQSLTWGPLHLIQSILVTFIVDLNYYLVLESSSF